MDRNPWRAGPIPDETGFLLFPSRELEEPQSRCARALRDHARGCGICLAVVSVVLWTGPPWLDGSPLTPLRG